MNCTEFKNLIPKWKEEKYTEKESVEFYEHLASCEDCIKIVNEIELAEFADLKEDKSCDISIPFIEINKEIQKAKSKKINFKRNIILKIAATLILMSSITFVFNNKNKKNSNNSFSIKWKTDFSGNSDSSPVICNNKIIIKNSKQNKLIAYDKLNGKKVWVSSFNVIGDVITDKKKIYSWEIIDNKLNLLSIAHESGNVIWKYDCSEIKKYSREFNLTFINNSILWTEKQTLFSLNSNTGILNWNKKLSADNGLLSYPIANNNSLFVATREKLLKLNINNGNITNEKKLDSKSSLFLRPVLNIDNDNIYVLSKALKNNGNLSCYDTANFKNRWSRKTKYANNLKIVKDNIFIRANELQVFNKFSGDSVWSEIVGGCGVLAYQDNFIYLINDKQNHQIMALDTSSGEIVKSLSLSDTSCSEIVFDDQCAYLNTNNGALYALNLY